MPECGGLRDLRYSSWHRPQGIRRLFEAWRLPENTMKVFFYGLFMDESLLASKGIRPGSSEPGYVDGFRLHIGERATLLPAQHSRSYGVLMEISADQAAALYSDRSVCDYVAEPVMVHLANDTQVAAVCYNLPATRLTGSNPQYAAALLALATRLGMPDRYLARIRSAAGIGCGNVSGSHSPNAPGEET